jgi:RNA polymerase sigma-70 factor (ECF subfamily)
MGTEFHLEDLPKPERDQFIPTRRSLLSRLRSADDHVSWADFFETYWRLIYSVALKSGLSDQDAQDVVQETVLSISKNIGEFRYDPAQGSFKGWLLKTTKWRILDMARRRQRISTREAALDDKTTEQHIDPGNDELDRLWEVEWQRNLLDTAVLRVKKQVKPKHYQAFELNVVKGWPAAKVADVLGMHTAQVHLAKHRVGKLIKTEIRRLQEKEKEDLVASK